MMRKIQFLIVSLFLLSTVVGCAGGTGSFCDNCNPFQERESGRTADGYTPSDTAAFQNGLIINGQFRNQVAPYDGAPIYVVNDSGSVYGSAYGGSFRPVGIFGESGRHGGIGRRGASVGSATAKGNGAGIGGPFRRGIEARRAQLAQLNADGYGAMNPYNHPNTPTRSPRDFFAPNPPSIGP